MFFGAFVLENLDMNYGYVIVGTVGLIAMVMIIQFMKTRVGLKSEEYSDSIEELDAIESTEAV
ncbi:hypothetical protein D3C76_1448610 [compost metagenome]